MQIVPASPDMFEALLFFWYDIFQQDDTVAVNLLINSGLHRMQKLAKELGVVIPVSFFEEANNAHYNSIAMIDADGSDLGLYRKSHIPDGPGA